MRETAALLLGAWVPTVRLPVHAWTTSRASGKSKPDRALQRHHVLLSANDVRVHGDVLVASAERTCFDCAAAMPFREAAVVVDSLLRLGADSQAISRLIDGHAGARGVRQVRRLLEFCDGKPDSAPEAEVRAVAVLEGLPAPQSQVKIPIGGMEYELDLGWRERKAGIEFDGAVKYANLSPSQLTERMHKDMNRNARLHEAGWVIMRVRWGDLAAADLSARIRRLFLYRSITDSASR